MGQSTWAGAMKDVLGVVSKTFDPLSFGAKVILLEGFNACLLSGKRGFVAFPNKVWNLQNWVAMPLKLCF